MQATSKFVNLEFHLCIEINYSRIIHCCLFFNRARKENKSTCYGRDYTKQYTSLCINDAQKAHPFYEAALHLTSLYRETMFMPSVPGYDQHLVSHGPQKRCQENQQCSCSYHPLMTLSLSSKQVITSKK